MKTYRVKMAAYPDGSGSSMEIPVNAYSEFHAMELARQSWPTWYPVAAYLR